MICNFTTDVFTKPFTQNEIKMFSTLRTECVCLNVPYYVLNTNGLMDIAKAYKARPLNQFAPTNIIVYK